MLTAMVHPFLMASIPLATAGLLAGVARRAKTIADLESQLDPKMQHGLCALVDAANWQRTTDEYAWHAVLEFGGRRHLLSQARLMLALMIEKSKESGEDSAVSAMEAKLGQITRLWQRDWRFLLMPSMNAHLCVDLYTDMCSIWEENEG